DWVHYTRLEAILFGVSEKDPEKNWWIDGDDDEALPWLVAIEAVDNDEGIDGLLYMLQQYVPPRIWPMVEDLFRRRKLVRRKGRPHATLYDPPKRWIAVAMVRELVKHWHVPKKAAIKLVSEVEEVKITFNSLSDYCAGDVGYLGELEKRRQQLRSGSSRADRKNPGQSEPG